MAQSLAISLGIHLALIAFIQPWRGPTGPRTVIINARLQPETPATPEDPAPELTTPEQTPPPPEPPAPLPEPPQPAQEPQAQTPSVPPQATPPNPAPSLEAETPASPPPSSPAKASPDVPSQPMATPAPAAETPTSPLTIPTDTDTHWYQARDVDKQPKIIGRIKPKYPPLARLQGQEGSLKVLLKIDDLGRVREVEVVESQPKGVFDDAGMEAFRNARFQPAIKNGRPVAFQAYMRVEFKLEE